MIVVNSCWRRRREREKEGEREMERELGPGISQETLAFLDAPGGYRCERVAGLGSTVRGAHTMVVKSLRQRRLVMQGATGI